MEVREFIERADLIPPPLSVLNLPPKDQILEYAWRNRLEAEEFAGRYSDVYLFYITVDENFRITLERTKVNLFGVLVSLQPVSLTEPVLVRKT